MNSRNKLKQFLQMLVEDVYFEYHGGFRVLPAVVVTIVLLLCVDAGEQVFEVPAGVAEGRFRGREKGAE